MDFVAKNQKIAKRASHIQKGEITPPSLLPPSLACVHAAAHAHAHPHPHHKYISWAWQQRETLEVGSLRLPPVAGSVSRDLSAGIS